MEASIENLVADLQMKLARVKGLLEFYNPQIFTAAVLNLHKDVWLGKVETAFTDLTAALYNLKTAAKAVEDNDLVALDTTEYEELVRDITAKVHAFTMNFSMKILSINHGGSESPAAAVGAHEEARKAIANVEVDVEKLDLDIKNLSHDLEKVDVNEADNYDVAVVVRSLDDWKKRFREIQNQLFSIKKLVRAHGLDEDLLQGAETAVDELGDDLEKKIADAEYEDHTRCLYSLSTVDSAKVPYPSFSDGVHEDFPKFECEMKDCMKTNKVLRDDQVKTLRKHLSGVPLSLVPEGQTDISKAFRDLNKMFGDASLVLQSKMDLLHALGKFPKPGSKIPAHLKAQLKWLTETEILLADLFVLSSRSTDFFCEVFKPSTLHYVKSLLPYKMCEEVAKVSDGDTKKKMESLQNYFVVKRNFVQQLLRDSVTGGSKTTHSNHADRTGIGGWDDEDEGCVTGSLDLDPNDPDDYQFMLMMPD